MICPKCKREVAFLHCWSQELVKRYFWIDSHGEVDYSAAEDYESIDQEDNYNCPECGKEIATTLEDAAKLFNS